MAAVSQSPSPWTAVIRDLIPALGFCLDPGSEPGMTVAGGRFFASLRMAGAPPQPPSTYPLTTTSGAVKGLVVDAGGCIEAVEGDLHGAGDGRSL